ncbi:MAG TPA: ABC transporter ATP-binding protein, partial [Chloroflexia bacterium]|nr:ABC transporter ATP-binding protein [Chloroflexia bacterium]
MARAKTLPQTLPGFWKIVRHFWPHLRSERGLLAGSFLALFAEVGLRLLEPWPLKLVFDRVIPTGAAYSTGVPFLDGLDAMPLLVFAAVAVVAVTALRALAAYFNTVGFALVGNKVVTAVRSEVYYHLQRLSLNFHTRARSGDLVVRVIGDVSQLKDVAVTAMLPMMANVLILVGMFALMLWLNWQLTLLALVTVPLFWLATARLSGRIQDAARKQRKREGAMAATAAESIGAIKIVQALSLEDTLARAFFDQNKQSLKQDAKASKLAASLERTVDVLIALSTGLVLWYGAVLVLNNTLTPGDLLVFLTYLKNGFKPVRDFAKYTGRLAKATAAGERVLDLLDREPDVRDLPGAVPAPAFSGAVRFSGVNFEYEPGHPVLRDINLTVAPGQHVALVGPSGNGKSTLVSLIMRLYDPTQGRVEIDGRDIREYTIESVRSQVSVVMQDTILFAASVRDNIAYGAPDATQEEVEAAARLANAHDFIMALPEGYDTVLGERGSTLSNGQRQRISIARAAIRRAPIVILDEPTTGLDEANERLVMQAIYRLIQGRTAFLITHRLSYAQHAGVILVMEHGRIVEWGRHVDLLRAGGVYSHLHDAPPAHAPVRSIPAEAPQREHVRYRVEIPRSIETRGELVAAGPIEGRPLTRREEPVAAAAYQAYPTGAAHRRRGARRLALLGGILLAMLVTIALLVAQKATAELADQGALVGGIASPASGYPGAAPLDGRIVITFSGQTTGPVVLDWLPGGKPPAAGTE